MNALKKHIYLQYLVDEAMFWLKASNNGLAMAGTIYFNGAISTQCIENRWNSCSAISLNIMFYKIKATCS